MKIDVHHMWVKEAMAYIMKQIDVCVDNQDSVLEVVHGFNQGVAIKSKLLRLNHEDHPAILRVRSHIHNPGISVIDLRVSRI